MAPVPDTGRPVEWTTDAAELAPKFGELSTTFEENTAKAYQAEALAEIRTEHAKYFEAVEQHPRALVGVEVPVIGDPDGKTEILKDSADAKEWQDQVKQVLVEEIRDRTTRAMEDNSDFLNTIHQSIELFQNNHDLIPGTKGFDVELANHFAKLTKPYELRVEGKLQGFSIPVQPIIDQLRADLQAARAAKPPAEAGAPAATGAPAAAAAADGKPADPPQAGIQSKAGNSSEEEDYSTLWGTLGLSNMRI